MLFKVNDWDRDGKLVICEGLVAVGTAGDPSRGDRRRGRGCVAYPTRTSIWRHREGRSPESPFLTLRWTCAKWDDIPSSSSSSSSSCLRNSSEHKSVLDLPDSRVIQDQKDTSDQ
ncbi:hypothetical protein E2C01_034218 [Portunus trituberculatus]|uniref:Uncharacterized protein n=1 Tax=Portunus trituberculatus TaxID=210409 RepID=A0A5B7F6H9_PORTR|nr:hypothetical protein [Portunus trituberculatus]